MAKHLVSGKSFVLSVKLCPGMQQDLAASAVSGGGCEDELLPFWIVRGPNDVTPANVLNGTDNGSLSRHWIFLSFEVVLMMK